MNVSVASARRTLLKESEREDCLHGPAVSRGAAEAAADAEVDVLRIDREVEGVLLLGARREVRSRAEVAVVLGADHPAVADVASQLHGRREEHDALVLAGEIELEIRIHGEQPLAAAVA